MVLIPYKGIRHFAHGMTRSYGVLTVGMILTYYFIIKDRGSTMDYGTKADDITFLQQRANAREQFKKNVKSLEKVYQ